MTDGKPPSDIDDENARVQQEFDKYLGVLAPKRGELARTCGAFDPDTCPFCDHYPECAAGEPGE